MPLLGTGTRGGAFRPYFTAGVGMLQTEARSNDDLFAVDNSEFGFNLGVGAMGFITHHVGFRGDLLEHPPLSPELTVWRYLEFVADIKERDAFVERSVTFGG